MLIGLERYPLSQILGLGLGKGLISSKISIFFYKIMAWIHSTGFCTSDTAALAWCVNSRDSHGYAERPHKTGVCNREVNKATKHA